MKSQEQTEQCFHCGQPVPASAAWSVEIDGLARTMCCPGCEAVAQSIVASGLADYYRSRESFSPIADRSAIVPPELAVYDDVHAASHFTVAAAADGIALTEAVFTVEGIRCAACVWLIERRLAVLPGVHAVNLNVATERLTVRWNPQQCKPSDLLVALRRIGYAAYPYDPVRHGEQLQRAGKTLFRQLFVAGLSMMQVMMYAVPVYLAAEGTMEADMEALMRWASLFLTLPAVCYSAAPFFRGAWNNLKAGSLGMDVPVALGIGAAFAGSVYATVRGQGDVYFDSVTMFIFLLLCSRYLELLARRKAARALEKLQQGLPASATRFDSYPEMDSTSTVAAARLVEGDFILIKPGEPVPADCMVLTGETAIDMSLLTGESQPQRRGAGDALPGGAVNASQAVVASVTRGVQDSTLSVLMRLIERAGQGKPQLALWADKVAASFVAALLAFSVAVFLGWYWIDPARAWPISIAVLVVSCPCALSLATPSALAAATDRLVRQGVLVVQPHVLETLHRASHVVFDKTGTLTVGQPVVRAIGTLGFLAEAACIEVAAALESSSAHPLGAAIVNAARTRKSTGHQLRAEEVRHKSGMGVEGMIDGTRYRLGSARYVQELAGGHPHDVRDNGTTSVYLGSPDGWLARFELADALREDAAGVVETLRSAGKEVILLSGDRNGPTRRIAQELGIREAYGECLPEDKLKFVQDMQRQGAVVAMVGDGINDAAVLRAADVSFAMGGGAALAQSHADAVLLSGRLSAVTDTYAVAAKTMRIVRQNLAWAMLYNGVAIPAAALGVLNPWLAGIGMSLSSALVVLNALRLQRMPAGRKAMPTQQPAPQWRTV